MKQIRPQCKRVRTHLIPAPAILLAALYLCLQVLLLPDPALFADPIELRARTAGQFGNRAQKDRGPDRGRLSRGGAGEAVAKALGSVVSLGKSADPVEKGTWIHDQSKKAGESGQPGKIGQSQVPNGGPQPPPSSTPPAPKPPSQFNPLQMCQQLLSLLQQAGQQGGGQQGGGQQSGGGGEG